MRVMTGNRRLRQLSSDYDAVRQTGKRRAAPSLLRHEDRELANSDRHRMIGATRSMARNFALVQWAIRKHLDYVTRFNFQMRTADNEFNASVESAMREWMRPANCDAAGRHSFHKLIRMAEARRTIDGDVFLFRLSQGQLQAIEADRIRQPTGFEGTWYNGIHVNPAGAAIEYALWDRSNEGGQFTFSRNLRAQDVIHHGFFDRFDQFRGISPLAAAINSFRDVYEGIDYALAKMKVEQLFALVFSRSADASPGTLTQTSTGYDVDFGKGPVQLDLDPGDEANFLKSDNPGANTQAFVNVVLGIAMKSLDLPFNFYDEAHTNFFGSRAAWLMYDRSCIAKRDEVQDMLQKITVWKLQQFIISGRITPPAGMAIRDMAYEWVHAGMPWWDPAKEINGHVAALSAGLDNPYRICKEAGRGEFEENVDAIARAQQYAAERGVSLSYVMQPVAVVDETEPNNSRGRQ